MVTANDLVATRSCLAKTTKVAEQDSEDQGGSIKPIGC